ncbi:MAG: hypothetical protein IPJ40_08035 [Saprospirales bacterium]|nr:hypothetical protein [Saprospirales bacterium]
MVLVVGSLGFVGGAWGQTTGDYRSFQTGTWSDPTDWQRWNGTTWVTNPSQGYPGQNSGTGNVFIQPGHTISIEISPANAIGSLTVGSSGTNPTLTFNSTTDRTLSVSGDVTVADGTFTVSNANGTNNHTLNIGGNLVVFATLSLNANIANNDFCTVKFNGSSHTISGSGTKSFYNLTFSNNGTVSIASNINDIDGTLSVGTNCMVDPAAGIN